VQEAWTGDLRLAVRIARATTGSRLPVSPVISAVVTARSAFAAAKLGDSDNARAQLESSLDTAETVWSSPSEMTFTDYYDQPLLWAQSGHTYLELGNYARAVELMTMALDSRRPWSARDRIIIAARMCLAYIQLADLDKATTIAELAFMGPEPAHSHRVIVHVRALRRALTPHKQTRGVDAVMGLIEDYLADRNADMGAATPSAS
jgi:tetratricopeptide (TPR) repeat protein